MVINWPDVGAGAIAALGVIGAVTRLLPKILENFGWKSVKDDHGLGQFCPVHEAVKERLITGDKRFDLIMASLDEHGKGIATLLERTKKL